MFSSVALVFGEESRDLSSRVASLVVGLLVGH